VGYYQYIIRDGVRDSPAAAYLGKGKRPAGLEVRTSAHVTRLLFQETSNEKWGENPVVTGVEYADVSSIYGSLSHANTSNLPRINVTARKEVIISAGSVNTPKLLMLSGIGPDKLIPTPITHATILTLTSNI